MNSTYKRFVSIKSRLPYKILNQNDIQFFERNVKTLLEKDDLSGYNQDWMGKYKGISKVVLKPKDSLQLSKILKYCNDENIAVVPQGGNTGLVGGSVPLYDEVIISTSEMCNIISFDSTQGILVSEAGAILEKLDNFLRERGFIMPLDLGAKGSCQIGGNVATNAGGLRLLRYGSLHGTVLSLEVVLPNGTIVEMGKPLRKDNTGYDLKQLFIGSEGTLGIISKVAILTPPMPKATTVSIVGVDSYERVCQIFTKAKEDLGEILSAFEFFDRPCVDLVRKHFALREPLEQTPAFYVLIETHGSNKDHDEAKLSLFLESLLEDEAISDGVLAQDIEQQKLFWQIRESITEACSKEGGLYKYDLSVPVKDLYSIVTEMRKVLREKGFYHPEKLDSKITNIVGFGHMGDGNLHLNINATKRTYEIESQIEPFVYEVVERLNGSISAEHGLGLMKAPFLKYSKNNSMINIMKQIKKMFDPKGIMNPYKYFE